MDPTEQFNLYLNGLNLQIDSDINFLLVDKPEEYIALTGGKIYYPIDRYDELDLVPVEYDVREASPLKIIISMLEFYNQPLSKANIDYYIHTDDVLYKELLERYQEGETVRLKDAMYGLRFVEGLAPYEDGYILLLGS